MNGLQSNLKERSQTWQGKTVYTFPETTLEKVYLEKIKKLPSIKYSLEHQLEGIVNFNGEALPVLFRSIIDSNNKLISSYTEDISLSYDIALNLGASKGDKVDLLVPHIVDEFFGDRPRTKIGFVSDLYNSNVPEVDQFHVFVGKETFRELTRTNNINKLIVYNDVNPELVKKAFHGLELNLIQKSWNLLNSGLLYALNLEKMMMIFLFSSLTFLISQTITCGLLLIFNKLKFDFAGLWVLGIPKKSLFVLSLKFLFILIFCLSILGLSFGKLVVFLLEKFGGNIMPDVFVETGIPVLVTSYSYFISFVIPFVLSFTFGLFSLIGIYRKQNHLETIRSVS